MDRLQKLEILATGSATHDMIENLEPPTSRESVLGQLQQLVRRDAVGTMHGGSPCKYLLVGLSQSLVVHPIVRVPTRRSSSFALRSDKPR